MTTSSQGRSGFLSALLRFLLMVAVLVAAYVLLRDSALSEYLALDRLSAGVERIRSLWWSPIAFVALWAALSPVGFPASPLVAAGAVVFGIWWGTAYNAVGALAGATTTFFFARYLGRDLVVHILGEERIGRVEKRLEQYGFAALVGIRLVPLPFPAVNIGAALAGFRYPPFLVATAIGIVPVIFVYTLLFSSLIAATTEESEKRLLQFGIAIAALALLVVLRLVLRRRSARLEERTD